MINSLLDVAVPSNFPFYSNINPLYLALGVILLAIIVAVIIYFVNKKNKK